MEKEQEYKIGANAYEFVQKHRSNLSHAKQAELQSMLKDFAIEQVKNSVVLADVSNRRELLIAFANWYDNAITNRDIDYGQHVDVFIEESNL